MKSKEVYWESYYAGRTSRILVPSQFACFVAQELSGQDIRIFDFGAGDGRDSVFFQALGFETVAIEGSSSAVSLLRDSGVTAIELDLGSREADLSIFEGSQRVKSCLYGRFLLHALTDDELGNFFELIGRIAKVGDVVAFEFRTTYDDGLRKETPKHFRRGVKPESVIEHFAKLGFTCTYNQQGFGYAKFLLDDAHVARLILKRG